MSRIITFCYDKISLLTRKANWHAIRHSIRFMKEHFGNESLMGAEIGVQRGAHAKNLLKNFNIKQLYLIDPYKNYEGIDGLDKIPFGTLYLIAEHNLRKFKSKIIFIREKSQDAIKVIPNEIDFVYIDGNHKYEYVKQDIEDYFKKIHTGGVLCGHDFDIPDVAQAVTEFAKKKNLKVYCRGYPGDWWIKNE